MRSKLALYLLGKKEGFDMNKLHQFVRETEKWNETQWQEYHREHLHKLLEHSYNHVPFYKNLMDSVKVHPNDIYSVKDLDRLPIVRKQDLIDYFEDFKADDMSNFRMIHHHTGGTTGKPCAYYMDRYSWALNWAIKMRTFEWAGYHYGDDCLGVLAGGSLIPGANSGWKHRLWRYVNNYYSMPITHLTDDILESYYNQIKKRNIQFLRGYPSAIAIFAEYICAHKEPLHLKAVFTTAEMLLPHQRQLIEKAFLCKPYDTYGCGDGMGYATECEQHNELHIYEECSIIQIVDKNGCEVKDGEEGEIVMTSLFNYGFPFIRYAPGDMAVKSEKKCPCGRHTKMIRVLKGRTSDNFKLINGNTLNALSLPFEELIDEVKQFQIVQEALDSVVLLIVPKTSISQSRLDEWKHLLEFHCGQGVHVQVKLVEDIDYPHSGKMRYIISNISK